MLTPMQISRRDWMLASLCWAELLQAQGTPRRLAYFSPGDAGEVRTMIAQIIPDDDTPGAESAGVIWFIDKALAGYDSDKRGLYKTGLSEVQAVRVRLFPQSKSIAGLTGPQQIELLKAIEKTEFFGQLRVHAIIGFFGNPIGWQVLGVKHAMVNKPPFGFYDAEVAAR